MSTQTYTPDQQTRHGQTPGGGPSRFRSWAVVIGAAAVVAIVALVMTLTHSHSSPAATTTGTPTSSSAPASPATPTTPSRPVTPPVKPSAAVMKLQQELGQLNYYEGPDDGVMGPQTIAAIRYLQRDAHLPQTGQMNAATEAALASFLAHGNNQMAG